MSYTSVDLFTEQKLATNPNYSDAQLDAVLATTDAAFQHGLVALEWRAQTDLSIQPSDP